VRTILWNRITAVIETGTGYRQDGDGIARLARDKAYFSPRIGWPMSDSFSRYVPDATWPRYAFVPGRGLPHPVRDPEGHLFGAEPVVERIDPERWRECHGYLWGVDLFNGGFYWEAHEAWEGVWRAYDRSETPALFLQGLIKLAAAGVKTREGVVHGVRNLAAGAARHFREVLDRPDGGESYCGMNPGDLERVAIRVEQLAETLPIDNDKGPRIVFDFVLRPGVSVT
jgi:uncharacterized protein